jgi:MOSC domain-containing protein YiiM
VTQGRVLAIHRTDSAGAPMEALTQAEVTAGTGLVGDRYALGVGTYSDTPSPGGGRELTLVAAEALDELAAEGLEVSHEETRRNVLTRGVDLGSLLGQRFRIGDVELEGVRPCKPCNYLGELADKPLREALTDRGGLRANVLTSGTIRVGDEVGA